MSCALTFKDEQYLYIFETFYRCGFNDNVILEHSLTLSLLIMSLCNTNLGGPKVDGVTTHGELQPIFLGYFEDEVYWYVIIYQFTIYLIIYLSNYLFFSAGHFQSVRPYRMGPVVQELITDGGVNLMQMLGLPDKSGEQSKNLCVSIRASNEPSRR